MEGEFDKIASIGMFEHVGIANYPTYFRSRAPAAAAARALSAPHHRAPRQALRARLPQAEARIPRRSPATSSRAASSTISACRSSNLERFGFEVHDVEGWREHYQRTTRLWWENLNARRSEAEAEVGPEKTRMWLLYLAGCSLAFERGAVGINQTLASKRARGPAGLPPTRADLYR